MRSRVEEARAELSTMIGLYRLDLRDRLAEIDAITEKPWGSGEPHEATILRGLWTALDRLDRAVQGEDYIERWQALSDRYPGAVGRVSPPAGALP